MVVRRQWRSHVMLCSACFEQMGSPDCSSFSKQLFCLKMRKAMSALMQETKKNFNVNILGYIVNCLFIQI